MSGFLGPTPRLAQFTRTKRSAVASTVVTAVVVIVIVAAVGGYSLLTSSSQKGGTQTSYSKSRSIATSSSGSSASSSASGASYPFELSLEHSSEAVVSPDSYTYIVVLEIHHSAPANESVALNSTSPPGIKVGFSPPSPVALPASAGLNVTLDITAAENASLGNATIGVVATSGAYSRAANFTLAVVEYRIVMSPSSFLTHSLFYPFVLNVTVGSTVYWQNLDGPAIAGCGPSGATGTGYHSVVFTTIPGANSSTMRQFEVYSYTFTTPGSYFYYSSVDTDHLMNGTINVLGPDGGIGMAARVPALSQFKATPFANATAGAAPGLQAGAPSSAPPLPHVQVWMAAVDLAIFGVGSRVGRETLRSTRRSGERRHAAHWADGNQGPSPREDAGA